MSTQIKTSNASVRPQGVASEARSEWGGLSDEALMEAYCAGEARAFEVLMGRYGTPIYQFVLRHVGNPARAEDLTQDVFLRVIRSADRFEARSKFSTWVYTIARNACFDSSRRMKHRRHASLDQPVRADDDRALVETVSDDAPDSSRRAMDQEFTSALELALAALPDEQREVFVMRQVQNLQFKEIAEITSTPVNTVKSRMRYALETLRLHLADHAPDGSRA